MSGVYGADIQRLKNKILSLQKEIKKKEQEQADCKRYLSELNDLFSAYRRQQGSSKSVIQGVAVGVSRSANSLIDALEDVVVSGDKSSMNDQFSSLDKKARDHMKKLTGSIDSMRREIDQYKRKIRALEAMNLTEKEKQ